MCRPRSIIATCLVLLLAGAAAAADSERAYGAPPMAGLEEFITAKILEANGQLRPASQAYERALRDAPEVTEVRVQYASLLVRVGLAERAVEVLDGVGDLDVFGRRVRALALAQYSGRDPERLDEAEAALRSALEDLEDDPNLLLSLGQVLDRLGRVAEAEAVIARLRASRGGSPQLVAYHAGLLKQLGRRQDAAELYAECAAAPSLGGVDCKENLVQLLVELGRPGEAGELMLGWLQDDDLDRLLQAASLLYEGGRYEQAFRTVQRVLRLAPDSPRARTLEAYLLSSTGRFEEALAAFRELLRRDRESLDLLLAAAWASANLGDHDEARRWVGRAWELVQDDGGSPAASRVALAAARVELIGEYTSQAREWLDRVVDYEGVGQDVVVLLAETYRREERWDEGVAALLRLQPSLQDPARRSALALEAEFRLRTGDTRAWRLLRPMLDSEDARNALVALQVLQNLERWEDVEREAGGVLARHPADRDVLFIRAAALERLARFDEAAVLFQELVDRDPTDTAAANYLGYSWADRALNLDKALELISGAVALEPENPAYLDSLGWVHFRLGDLDQAEYWLRRAVGFAAGDGTILSHLGEVLIELGQPDEGRRLLRRALELGCEHLDHVRELLEGVAAGE